MKRKNLYHLLEILTMESIMGECSVMKEISKTEEAIKTCYERVHSLEKRIGSDISEGKKEAVRRELSEVRKLLATNEAQLSQLHKHNQKSFAFVVVLCFVCFTVYALYVLVYGRDF